MIELIHLEKKYEQAFPLKDVNALIKRGDVISVIGPSGTGKSTLLRCINLLEKPTGGQILLDGEDITAPKYDPAKARRRMGMVFQNFNLFGHLTVIENLMLAQTEVLNKTKQEAYDTGAALLKRVGLAGREFQYPDQLSGGQKQRVAIARTLAMDPDVILLDEPTSALDPTMVGEVQAVIRDLAETGKTMMIVTHEMNFARSICNRVFYMDQGVIFEDGTPKQVFDHPLKEQTRRFIRKLKVLEFEELVQQILLPVLNRTAIHVAMEYSEEQETATVTIVYGGERFDPAAGENDLAYTVLKRSIHELTYIYTEGAELSNTVCAVIRS